MAKLVYSRGEDYDRTELRRLQRYVQPFFNIPPLESGIEAFLRMASCDPLAYFADWQMLKAIPKSEPLQLYRDQESICIDESNIGSLEFTSDELFGEQSLSVIREFGARLPIDDVRVFLLWENPD